VVVVAGFLFPLGLAVAWLPLRALLPNTDVALVLVLAVTAIGWTGRRAAVVAAAVSASFWFDFFHTQPYQQLSIARSHDLATTLLLVAVGLLAGELAVRVKRHRSKDQGGAEGVARIHAAAELVAGGEPPELVIEAVAGELIDLLELRACSFEPSVGSRATAAVQGEATAPEVPTCVVELPVRGQGQVFGRFVLDPRDDRALPADRLLVAVSLADQVGATLAAQPPGESGPPHKPTLKVVS
jgi:K+-sensing histidine kinase KdpD